MSILVTASDLKPRLGEAGLALIDVRPQSDWLTATLPGALSLNVYDYFIPQSTENGIARMAEGALAAFRRLGIDRARTVVFFENQTGMISPRGLWFHELVGLSGGLVLDGGCDSWLEAGGGVTPGEGRTHEVRHGDGILPAGAFCRDLVASRDEVLNRDPAVTDILDVRRRSEFEGTFLHPCCTRPGRIPDARFLFFEDMLVGGRYRPADEIRARAEAAGLSPEREIVTYCHRGARAATALYGLRLAGFERIRIFVGSWHEWAADAELPIAIGPCETNRYQGPEGVTL